jgi:hypothetical protein
MIIFEYIRTLEEKYQEVEESNKKEMERVKIQHSLNSTSKLNLVLCIDPCYS